MLLLCSSPHESAVCIRLGEHGPAAAKKKPGQLSDEQLDQIREAFCLFDSDASFQIDVREPKAAMQKGGASWPIGHP